MSIFIGCAHGVPWDLTCNLCGRNLPVVAGTWAQGREVELQELARAARDFAGYVPFGRLRKGGRESWNRLRVLLDRYDRAFYETDSGAGGATE